VLFVHIITGSTVKYHRSQGFWIVCNGQQ